MIFEMQKLFNEYAERIAIEHNDEKYTYQQLENDSERLAGSLNERGFSSGDRIALFLPNSYYYAVCYLGILKAGCVVVPLNILNDAKELRFIFEDSLVKGIMYWNGFEDLIKEAVNLSSKLLTLFPLDYSENENEDDIKKLIVLGSSSNSFNPAPENWAVIQYSTGNRKTPRGTAILYKNIEHGLKNYQEIFQYKSAYSVLAVLPFFHPVIQLFSLLLPLLNGARIIIQDRFDPGQVVSAVSEKKVDVIVGVPLLYSALAEHLKENTGDFSSVKYAVVSGAQCDERLCKEFEEKFSFPVISCYGTTESFFIASANRRYGKRKEGSLGYSVDTMKIKILDADGHEKQPMEPGEIYIQGDSLGAGYVNGDNNLISFLKNDWFPTGDWGYQDYEGFFHFLEKKEEIIFKGGFPVYPNEIQDILLKHEDIKEVAVIGVKDDRLGQEIKIYLTLHPGKRISPQEIIDHCKKHLEEYKCPKYFKFTASIPKGPTGKTLNWLLRKWESR